MQHWGNTDRQMARKAPRRLANKVVLCRCVADFIVIWPVIFADSPWPPKRPFFCWFHKAGRAGLPHPASRDGLQAPPDDYASSTGQLPVCVDLPARPAWQNTTDAGQIALEEIEGVAIYHG